MALSVGSYVTLSGLKGRADLNERTGRILGAAKDGRLPIRVMDECNQVLKLFMLRVVGIRLCRIS
jgi:hypothetical protein